MSKNQNKRLKQLTGIIATTILVILLSFAGFVFAKYILNRQNDAKLNFYEYRIAPSEIVISPEDYTGEEVTVTITTKEPGLSIQYKLGDSDQWIDYTGPFSVDENINVEARLVADNFEGPVTEKDIRNIAVAKIGDSYYKTLESAIEACPENTGNNQTKVQMLTSVIENVVVPEGKNIILDLSGMNVKSNKEATIIVNGTLQLVDSIGDGQLESTLGVAVKVGKTGKFTMGTNEVEPIVSDSNPRVIGESYGVFVEENGEFNFYDGKIIGKTNAINRAVSKTPESYAVVNFIEGECEIATLRKSHVITFDKVSEDAVIEYESETINSGYKIGKLPTAQRKGYLFDGWYTEISDGEKVTIDTIVTEEVTYYAHWTNVKYLVKYNANGGTGTIQEIYVEYDKDIEISEDTYVAPAGYTFKEWNTKADGTGTSYRPLDKVRNLSFVQSEIVNLYAIWEDKQNPTTTAPTGISTTNIITVNCNQKDEGSGIDESAIEYSIYKDGEWSDWQTSNIFEELENDTEYEIKTRVIDKDGNGPIESEAGKIKTKKIQIGTISIHKDTKDGEIVTPKTDKEDKNEQINNDIYISITPSEEGTTIVKVKTPDGEIKSYTEDISIETETGSYEITIETTDGTNTVTETVYVFVDKTPPEANPTTTNTTNTIMMNANAKDEDSGIDEIKYIVKTGDEIITTITKISNDTDKTVEIPGLKDNTEYTVEIIVTDKAGNEEKQIVTVNTEELIPGWVIFTKIETNTEFTPTVNINENKVWINENVKTKLLLGNAGTTTYTVQKVGEETSTEYTNDAEIPTTDGYYIVTIETTDGTNTKIVKYYFGVDKTLPIVAINPNGREYTIPVNNNTTNIEATLTSIDNENGSGINTNKYAWSTSKQEEPDSWSDFVSGTPITNTVSGGIYYLWTKVYDNAGNEAVSVKTSKEFNVGYAVEYDTNGGNKIVDNQRKVHDENLTLTNSKPTKDGYIFRGWGTSKETQNPEYSSSAIYSENESIKLYAIWSEVVASTTVNGITTNYDSVQNAINAAGTNEAIVTLMKSEITESITIATGQNISLDLNGKTLTGLVNNTISNYGTLIIDNEGKVTSFNASTISNTGNLIKNGNGIIENTTQADYSAILNTGNIIFNDGTISSTNIGISNNRNGKLTITGGIIESVNHAISNTSEKSEISNPAVRIIGGMIKTSEHSTIENMSSEALIYIDGGEILQDNTNSAIVNSASGKIFIKSGTIHSNTNSAISNNNGGIVEITGGNITGTKGISSNGILILGDNSDEVSTKVPQILGCISIIDGTFNFYDGVIKSRDITIEGTVTDTPIGYRVVNGTETIEGVEYKTAYLNNKYYITFNDNTENGTSITKEMVYNDKLGILPNPTITVQGYTFDGWYTEKNDGEKVTEDNNIIDDITLYAHWRANEDTGYTVYHYIEKSDASGYTLVKTENLQGTTGEELILADLTIETGEFADYFYEKASLTLDGDEQTKVNIAPDGSTQIYIYYIGSSYPIYYNEIEGATFEQINPSLYTRESDEIILNNPSKTGYTFVGWTGSNGDTPEMTVVIPKGSSGIRTYVANWQINSYTVTFDYGTNGGTSNINNSITEEVQEVKYNWSVDLSGKGKKDNYTFIGWNTDETATNGLDYLVVETSNITLYAIYEKDVTVKFDRNGGDIDISNTYKMYNKDTELEITMPEETNFTGWTFNGYSTSNSAESGDYAGTVKTIQVLENEKEIKYYHTWKKEVKFNENKPEKADESYDVTINENSREVYYNNKFGVLPVAPSLSGWRFEGFYTSKVNGTKIEENTMANDIPNTIYAHWTLSASISVAPKEVNLDLSNNVTQNIIVTGSNFGTITYEIDDESVATIDENGRITAVSNGNAVVTVKSSNGEITKTINVTVITTPTSVTISEKEVLLGVLSNNIHTLNATIMPETANSNNKLTWSSSNNDIATVDEKTGVVTGVSDGKAIITVQTANGFTDTCEIIVDNKEPIINVTMDSGYYEKLHKASITITDENCGLPANQVINYAWSKDGKNAPTEWQTKTILTTEGNKTVTTEVETDKYITGEYYLWIKAGIKDRFENVTNDNFVNTNAIAKLDNTLPVIEKNGISSPEKASSGSTITVPLKITEAHSGLNTASTQDAFNADDIVVKVNGVAVDPNTKILTYNSNNNGVYSYTLTLEGIEGNGELLLEIEAGKIADKATNKNEAITINTGVTMDDTAFSCSITSDVTSPTNSANVIYTFTFNKQAIDFIIDDIEVTNGTKGTFTKVSDKVYTLVVTNNGTCEQTVRVKTGASTDNSGNSLTEVTPITIQIDRTAPTAPEIKVKAQSETGITKGEIIAGGNGTVYTGIEDTYLMFNGTDAETSVAGYKVSTNPNADFTSLETVDGFNFNSTADGNTYYVKTIDTVGNISETATSVTVKLVILNVTPVTVSVENEKTTNLVASGENHGTVTWISSDETVAVVSSTGVVTAKKVGTVTITAIAENDNSITTTSKVTVTKGIVQIPESIEGLVYNGKEQIGVPLGEKYNVVGNTATDAGTYTATVSLKDTANYVWSDGTTNSKSITFTILEVNYAEYNNDAIVGYYITLSEAMENVTNGNTIKPLKDTIETAASTLESGKIATLDLNGKTITLANEALTNNGELTISGSGILTTALAENLITNMGTLNLKDEGTISNTATGAVKTGTILNEGTLNKTGRGTIITSGGHAVVSRGVFTITDGTISSMSGCAVIAKGTVTVSGENTVIQKSGTAVGAALQYQGTETMTLSGGTIKTLAGSESGAVNNSSTGTIRIAGANIEQQGANAAVTNMGTGTIEVTDGIITSKEGTTGITNSNTGTVIITGGNIISANGAGIKNNSTGTVIVGTNETTPSVSTTVPSITGKTVGVDTGTGTFNFYDGVIIGRSGSGSAIKGTVAEVPTGYGVQKTYTTNNFAMETATLVQANYEEVTSDTTHVNYYETLALAMQNVTSGNIIKVLNSRTETSSVTLASGKIVTLNTNGKTITLNGVIITNNGILTVNGSGNIIGTKEGIENKENGRLTISDVTIETTGTTIRNYSPVNTENSPAVKIISGTIKSKTSNTVVNTSSATGLIVINGGNISSEQTVQRPTVIDYQGKIIISGGEITSINDRAVCQYQDSKGSIEVRSGTIIGERGISVNAGEIIVTGGNITGNEYGLKVGGTGILTLGTNETTPNVSITTPSITGSTYGVSISEEGKFNFYDGVIKGESGSGSAIKGTVAKVPTGYVVNKTINGTEETALLGPSLPIITAKLNNSSGAAYTSGEWTNQNVYISLSSSNVGAGIKEYQWYEKGAWTTRVLTTSNNVGTITYTVNRNETLRFRAIDNNGVISSEVTFNVKIDKTLPTIAVSPTNSTACKQKSVTITVADTGGSTLSSSNSYQYYLSSSSTALSGGTWTNYTSGTEFTIGNGITGTRYLFVKRVSDNAGNTSTANGTGTTVGNVTYQRFGSYVFDNKAPTAWINTESMYITDGLIARLDGVNNKNGSHSASVTTWSDISGNSKNGTITNGTWGANYLNFNGSSSWVNLGVMNSDYQTMEATFSPDVVPTSGKCIIGNWQTGGGGIQINSNGYIMGNYYIEGSYRTITSRVKVVAGNKYHAAITYNGSTVVLYVNGVEQGRISVSGTIGVPANSTVMVLGANPSGSSISGEYFQGKIYSAAIYNKALTATQVKTNADAGKVLAGGPTNASSITYTIRFNETVTGFTTDDITITNGTKGTFTTVTSGKVFNIVVTTLANQNNTQTIALAANGCTDTAGNSMAAISKTVVIDRVAPTVTLSTNGGTYNITPGNTTVSISTTLTATDTGSGIAGLGYSWSTSNSTQPSSWTIFTSGTEISGSRSGGNSYIWTNVIDNAGNRATSVKTSNVFTVRYQVVFNANSGSGAPSTQYKVHASTLTLSSTKPTRTGHTFKEWNTKADGTGTSYAPGASYTANSAVTLYAIWTVNNYTITYNYNGTKNYIEPNAETITCTGFTGTQNKCFNIGKIYVDDLTASDKLTISYDVSYSGLTAADGQTANAWGQASGDVTAWSPSLGSGAKQSWLGTGTASYSYTVTMSADKIKNDYFNLQLRCDYYSGGTIKISNIKAVRTTTESKSLPYGTGLGTLPSPSETGYTLKGWYTSKTGGTKVSSTTTVPAANTTYYAQWTAKNYTVTYDYASNGGTSATKTTETVVSDGLIDLTPTATKSGYTFVGWNTNKDATTKLTYLPMRESNVTLYAIYSKTITATCYYYNNQSTKVSKTIYNNTTSASLTLPTIANQTVSSVTYTARGWSTSNSANATINVNSGASVTLSANTTYYASYSASITGTFYYCTLASTTGTFTNAPQSSKTASASRYMSYTGAFKQSNYTVPTEVTESSGGTAAESYLGVATATGSATKVTPTTANTKFYAIYTESLTFYYYNGSEQTSKSVTRRMLSNGSTYSTSLSETAPTPSAYDGATYKGWTYKTDSVDVRTPTSTGVNKLYAYYQKSITGTFNYHDGTQKATATASATRTYISKSGGVNTLNANYTIPDVVKANRKISNVTYTYRGVSTSNVANATVATPTTASTTFYASYSYKVTVAFNGNGSSSGTAPTSLSGTAYMNYSGTKVGASLTMPSNTFTKSGYTFDSWNTKTDGTGTDRTVGSAYRFTANSTLYAKWLQNNYQELKANGTHVKYYVTLADAMQNVTTGNTIKVLNTREETEAATLDSGKIATLDFGNGGKAVILKGVSLTNNGTLTIKGNGNLSGSGASTVVNTYSFTQEGTALITNTSTSTYYALENSYTANLSGTITSSYRGIRNTGQDTMLKIDGLNLTATNNAIVNESTNISSTLPSILIQGDNTNISSDNIAVYNNAVGRVIIRGGTIEAKIVAVGNYQKGTVEIDAGNLSGTNTIVNTNGSDIRIGTGDVNITATNWGIRNTGDGCISVAGGTITGDKSGINNTNRAAEILIKGGTIKGISLAGLELENGNATIENATITGGGTSSDGTLVSGAAGILNKGTGRVTIKSGNITCFNGTNYGIKNTNSGTIEILQGNISTGMGGTGIKATSGYIILGQKTSTYSGATVTGYIHAIDLTESTGFVQLEIGASSNNTFDNNSELEQRRPYITGRMKTIIGDNSENIKVIFRNGTIRTSGGNNGQGGGGATIAYDFYGIPYSQIIVRSGYRITQDGSGTDSKYHTYLAPDTTNTSNTTSAISTASLNTVSMFRSIKSRGINSNNNLSLEDIEQEVNYKIEHYYQDKQTKEYVIDNELTDVKTAKYEEVINITEKDKKIKTGYVYEKSNKDSIIVSDSVDDNIIKLYYKIEDYNYSIHYFYDGIEDKDKVVTGTTKIGSKITEYEDKIIPGYKIQKIEPLNESGSLELTIQENEEKNVINVYYIKDIFEYKVHYFYDGVEVKDKVETLSGEFESKIKIYQDKNVTGYKLKKCEPVNKDGNLELNITENIENNSINVYYEKDEFEYTVHYFYDGIEDKEKMITSKALFGDKITTYEDKKIEKYKLGKNEPANENGDLELKITDKPENNVINVYYKPEYFITTDIIEHTENYKNGDVKNNVKGGNIYLSGNNGYESVCKGELPKNSIKIVPTKTNSEEYEIVKVIVKDGKDDTQGVEIDLSNILDADGNAELPVEYLADSIKGLESDKHIEVEFRKKTKIIVKHLEKETEKVLYRAESGNDYEEITGYEGMTFETNRRLITNYQASSLLITNENKEQIKSDEKISTDEKMYVNGKMYADTLTIIYWYEEIQSGIIVKHIEVNEQDKKNGLTIDSGVVLDEEVINDSSEPNKNVRRKIYTNTQENVENSKYKDYVSQKGPEINDKNIIIAEKEENIKNATYSDDAVLEVRYYYEKQYNITAQIKTHKEIINGQEIDVEGGEIVGNQLDPYEVILEHDFNKKGLEINPKVGYRVKSLTVNGKEVNIKELEKQNHKVVLESGYFKDIQEDKEIVVEFEKIPAKVIVKYQDINTKKEIIPDKEIVRSCKR